jgi:hypothetical protein
MNGINLYMIDSPGRILYDFVNCEYLWGGELMVSMVVDNAMKIWCHCIERGGWSCKSIFSGIEERKGEYRGLSREPKSQEPHNVGEWPPEAVIVDRTLKNMEKIGMRRNVVAILTTYIEGKEKSKSRSDYAKLLGITTRAYEAIMRDANLVILGALLESCANICNNQKQQHNRS